MKFIKKHRYKILFLIILLIALLTRFYLWPNLLEINIDEAMTTVNANAIAQTGKDIYNVQFPVYLEAWGFAGQSVMLTYIMVICIKIFGFSLFAVRLPMMLVSIVSLFIFYDLAKRIFKSQKIALVALALLAICPWQILQSKWSIDCNMFPHFALFSIYFLYRGICDKKIFLYISMIFFGLTMYTYGISIYFIPLFLLISAIYLLIHKKITIKELLLCILIYFVIFLPLLIMYVINFLKIDTEISLGLFSIRYFANSSRTSDMLLFSENIFQQLWANIVSLGRVLFIQYDYLEWNATAYFGTIYHISLIFVGIAFVHYIIKKEKNIGIKLFMLWMILSLFTGIFINGTNINRLNIIWYPLVFLTVYGLVICYQKIKKKKYFLYGIGSMYIALFIGYNVFFYTSYYKDINLSGCFASGLKDAIAFLDKYDKDKYYLNIEGNYGYYIYMQMYSGISKQKIVESKTLENIDTNAIYVIEKDKFDASNFEGWQINQFDKYVVIIQE